MSTEKPESQSEINRVIHRLNGNVEKFTVTVYLNDGSIIEVQSKTAPRPSFDVETRADFLCFGYDYEHGMIPMTNVRAVICELNPTA